MTSTQVDVIFAQQFANDIIYALQQETTLLRNTVNTVNITRVPYNAPKIGEVTVVNKNKPRHADIVPNDTDHSSIPIYTDVYHIAEYIDYFDELKTNPSLKSAYQENIMMKANRIIDGIIIDALAATTSTVLTLPTANTLDYKAFAYATKVLNKANVKMGNRTILTSSGGAEDMLLDDRMTNALYQRRDDIYTKGIVNAVMGYDVVNSNYLPTGGGSNTKTFFYQKECVTLAILDEIKTNVAYIPQKDSTLVTLKLSMGAKVIQDAGVQYAVVTD